MTTRCGVVLHPAGHTLSPVLHTAAYRALGLDASFEVFDVEPAALGARVRELREGGVRQLSVSLPHKESVLALADTVSSSARAIGAANTLTFGPDGTSADNTDWLGVVRSLETLGPWAGSRGLVVGAGGAARAAVYALRELGLEVAVVNRTRSRAEKLARDLGARVGSLDDEWELLVHVTPLGMDPDLEGTAIPAEKLRAGATVLDAVYRPLETRLLREARERDCRVADGLDWLVHQALEQLRLWSGETGDAALLRRAGMEALL